MKAAAGEPLNIKLSGPDFEPTDERWRTAPEHDRAGFWRHVGDYALDTKRREIRRGIGADGRKLKPVKPRSRPDNAKGPPLIPHYAESRTQRLLAVKTTGSSATLYWRSHGRNSWARILGYHAYKHGPRALPVRNTIGISPAGLKAIAREAREWWDLTRRKTEPKPQPKPKKEPPPAAPPAVTVPKPPKPPKSPKPASPPIAALPPGAKPGPGGGYIIGRVHYLAKGQKVNPRSKYIQVTGGAPKLTPKVPTLRPKPIPPPPVIPPPKAPPRSPAVAQRPLSPPEMIPPRPKPKVEAKAATPPPKPKPKPAPKPPKAMPKRVLSDKPPPVVHELPAVPAPPPPLTMARLSLSDRAIAIGKAHGVDVEPDGYALIEQAYGAERAKDVHAVYEARTRKIYLNPRSDYWTDPANTVKRWSQSGYVSSASEDHAIVHELGHALHHREIETEQYLKLRGQKFGEKQADYIKKHVSIYAAKNPLEFIAEVYAGLRSGKQYDRVVMKFYDQIKGPRP